MVSSTWSTKFCCLIFWFILTYPLDLICLAFAVNGGRCQHNCRNPIVWHPQTFLFYIFTYPENFICLVWVVKNFEGPVGGWLPNCGTWNLSYFTYLFWFFFFFYIHLLWKFHVSTVNGWKAWIWRSQLRVPHFGTNKFRQITLCYIYLIWKSSVLA